MNPIKRNLSYAAKPPATTNIHHLMGCSSNIKGFEVCVAWRYYTDNFYYLFYWHLGGTSAKDDLTAISLCR